MQGNITDRSKLRMERLRLEELEQQRWEQEALVMPEAIDEPPPTPKPNYPDLNDFPDEPEYAQRPQTPSPYTISSLTGLASFAPGETIRVSRPPNKIPRPPLLPANQPTSMPHPDSNMSRYSDHPSSSPPTLFHMSPSPPNDARYVFGVPVFLFLVLPCYVAPVTKQMTWTNLERPCRAVSLIILIDQHLNNLAVSLRDRFKQHGVLSDLDEAIELHRAALALRPPGHPSRSSSLNNLASNLRARFEQRRVLFDLDEAIELHRAALDICPPGYSDRFMSLNNLGINLQDRFQQRGVLSDLDEAIELHHAALLLRPPGHSDRSMSFDNLAVSLGHRFQQRGVLSDLDEVIELHRVALLLRPPGHSLQTSSLNNLAISLRDRFQQRGIPSDLDEAIELHRTALALCPPDHSDRSMSPDNLSIRDRFQRSLNDLTVSLRDRYQKRGVLSDLDEAIELHRAALLLSSPGHSLRTSSLNNLAISLRDRFQQQSNLLAISLRDRFKHQGASSDLDDAIELHRAALQFCPPGHYLRTSSLNHAAVSLQDRFQQRGIPSDLEEAFRLYLQLSHLSHAVSRSDLNQHVTSLSSSSRHFDVVREATSSLAMDAFSCSVRHGAFTTAVELVEQGRAVFWTRLSRFRTPLDELSASGDTGAALAEEFKQPSFRLRKPFDQSTEDQSPQIRQLTMQWEDVVSRIRILPVFSRFLLPPLFSGLQKAAEEGPVIIVNASQYSCDALIISSVQDPIYVPLDIAWTEVSELSSEFQSLTGQFGSSEHQHELVSILRKLWDHIVDPVVQALRESRVHRGSRIWWCPTAEFALLLLHAAGPYEKKKDNLFDIYISSYTPTLVTLIRARQQVSRDALLQHFVAIGQGNLDKGKNFVVLLPS
ncbi:uncharacterized protein EDB91DRAFT_1080445 [Suillus paluster]|uniref:uncharacterized protein n=1 Tax=Suillus paluster TaxID=48578 RepID=UPI001B85C63D|nr:uncharacterized protein EDB91DRAFT_1080445 [Suillus paluster]KAG1744905.1 hypothetical protein EDB91DRAFT_1080445 [Suillus paluster]